MAPDSMFVVVMFVMVALGATKVPVMEKSPLALSTAIWVGAVVELDTLNVNPPSPVPPIASKSDECVPYTFE